MPTTRRGRWTRALCVALASSSPGLVDAAEGVVLVDATEAPDVGRQLEAEVRALGLSPEEAVLQGNARADALTRKGAVAAVMIRRAGPTTRTVTLVVIRRDGTPYESSLQDADPSALALRAAEQLHAALIEFELMPLPPGSAGTTTPDPVDTHAVEREPVLAPASTPDRAVADHHNPNASTVLSTSALWGAGGFAGSLASGGIGPTPQIDLGLRYEIADWAVATRALVPVSDNEFSAPEGEAEVSVNVFLLQGAALAEVGAWQLDFGPGAGLAVLPMEAEAVAPNQAHREQSFAAIGYFHASGALPLTDWMRVRTTLLGGFVAPRQVVAFAGREVVSWGRFLTSAALTLEVNMHGSRARGVAP